MSSPFSPEGGFILVARFPLLPRERGSGEGETHLVWQAGVGNWIYQEGFAGGI